MQNFLLSLKLLLPGNPIILWGHSLSLPAAAVSNSTSLIMQAPVPKPLRKATALQGGWCERLRGGGKEGTGGGKLEWQPLGFPCVAPVSLPCLVLLLLKLEM